MNSRIVGISYAPLLLLLLPLILGAPWTLVDYLVGGVLLFLLGSAHLIIVSTVKPRYRIMAIALAIIVFLLIWAELAVGIFGTPFAGS